MEIDMQLMDEIYVTQRTVSPGGIFNHIKFYFKRYDPNGHIVHVTLDREGKRETIISARAISMVKDAITGEIKYERDYRNVVLGNNL